MSKLIWRCGPSPNPQISKIMNPSASDRSRGCGWACLALSLLWLASQGAFAGTTIIYKCLDGNLGVVYTDEPCKGGERMSIRAGDADPSAVARLEREREALDRSAAQRILDERRIAAQRNPQAFPAYPGDQDAPDNAFMPYDSGWAGGPALPLAQPQRPRFPRGNAGQRFSGNLRSMARS
jgi:hypothetical protein